MARPLSKAELEKKAVPDWQNTVTVDRGKRAPTGTPTNKRFTEDQSKRLTGERLLSSEQNVYAQTVAEAEVEERRRYQIELAQERAHLEARKAALRQQEEAALIADLTTHEYSQGVVPRTVALNRLHYQSLTRLIITLYLSFWASVQITIAGIALAFLALEISLNASWLGRLTLSVLGSATSLFNGIFGTNFTGGFLGAAMAVQIVLLGIFLFILFTVVVVYILCHQRPLFGEKSSLKIGLLLLSIVGYAVPIANLFPWLIFYLLAMLRYPR